MIHFHGTDDQFAPFKGGKGEKSISGTDFYSVDHSIRSWVKANGYGGIDKARFAKSIEQIGLTFKYKSVPKVEDIFTEAYLPAALADRKVD